MARCKPQRVELVQEPDGALRIGHQGRLGDLELEAGGRDTVLAERVAATRDEARLLELAQRQIHGDAPGSSTVFCQAR